MQSQVSQRKSQMNEDPFASDSEDSSNFYADVIENVDSIEKAVQKCIQDKSIDNLSSVVSALLSLKKSISEKSESVSDEINNALFQLSAENDQLKSKLNLSNKKCEALTKEVEKIKASKSEIDLDDEISELQLDKANLQIEIENLRIENEEMKQKLHSIHSSEIQNEVLIEWREKYFKIKEEMAALLNEIETIKAENGQLKNEHSDMKEKMATVNEIIENLNNKTNENEKLNQKIAELALQIKQSKEKEYYDQIEQNKQTIASLQKEIASQKLKIDELNQKLSQFDDIKNLNEQLKLENGQIGRYKLQVLEMEKLLANHEATILENVEVKTENKNLKKKSYAFQEKLKESLEQSNMLIQTLTEYRSKVSKITELENQNLELNDIIEKLQNELSEKDQVFESLQKKIEEKFSGLVRENKELKLALKEQVEIHEEQAKQQELDQKKIQILTEMNSESIGKLLIEKDAEIETLKKDNQTLQTISKVSAEQVFQFQTIIEKIKENVSLLSQENKNIKNDCMSMKDELQLKEEEVNELKSKISMLESINDDEFAEDEEVEVLKKENQELQSKLNLVEMADIISLKSRIKTLTDQLEESRFQNRLLAKKIQLINNKPNDDTDNTDNISSTIDNDNKNNDDIINDVDKGNHDENELEVDTDDDFVDIEVVPPVFIVEKKGLEDIRSEFVRYLNDVGKIDDVMKVIKNEDDKNIRNILNEIKKPDKNEINYLQNELNEATIKNKEMMDEINQLRIKSEQQSKEIDEMKHDSNMYQKHLDDLAHLLKK